MRVPGKTEIDKQQEADRNREDDAKLLPRFFRVAGPACPSNGAPSELLDAVIL